MGNSKSKQDPHVTQRDNVPDDEEASNGEETEHEQHSYWQMIKHGYQELVNAIIRPPRCNYELSQLGPKSFEYCGKLFQRTDFDVINERGMKVVCSIWEPSPSSRNNVVLPCVIYMHGNSSARPEALGQLSLVLSLGATLVTFDFCGSGQSDGEYVSLGFYEKDDLKAVIEYLRNSGTTSTIALWGRSMGAATALLHGERDPSIAGMILDSAFSDLQQLAEEMVEKGRQSGLIAPSFVVKIAIRMIRGSVQKAANFDIRQLSPIEHADRCFIPAMFVAADGDEFVPPHHSRKIHEKYSGDKNIIIVDGDHNSTRPVFLYDSALIFLVHVLQIPEHWMGSEASRNSVGLPWQQRRSTLSSKQINRVARQVRADSARGTWHDSMVEPEMGYTNEMQANVRGKLFSMLGDRGQVAAAAASASANANGNTNGNVNSNATSGARAVNSSSDYNFAAERDGLDIDNNEEDLFDYQDGDEMEPPYQGEYVDSMEDLQDWVCTTCTVINESSTLSCLTCDAPRFT